MMQVNVKSALYGMQEVLPHFKARNSGHIINISSMLGRMPTFVPRAAYSASKHFLNALTANFRTEIQETHPGIQVSLVSPGVVATDFGLNAMHGGVDSRTIPGGQTAEQVAAVIAGVIESTEGRRLHASPTDTRLVARVLRGRRDRRVESGHENRPGHARRSAAACSSCRRWPAGRRRARAIDIEQNDVLVRHMLAGGLTRLLYGGNAFLYHVTRAEFETLARLDGRHARPTHGPSRASARRLAAPSTRRGAVGASLPDR